MTDVTGRDGYIMRKALAYAIITIERLPERWREASDCEDMRRLFAAIGGHESEFANARMHIEQRETTDRYQR